MDVTASYRDAVRRRRTALGLPTPAEELLWRRPERGVFATEASSTLQKIRTTGNFLRERHSASLLDDGLNSMSDAERDEIDAETQQFLQVCSERIDDLKEHAVAHSDASSPQLTQHQQATVQLLYEHLQRVASIFEEQRGARLRPTVETRDQRLTVR